MSALSKNVLFCPKNDQLAKEADHVWARFSLAKRYSKSKLFDATGHLEEMRDYAGSVVAKG
jgi:hypothetical protein